MKGENRIQQSIYDLMPALVRYIYPVIHKYSWNGIEFRENQIMVIMALYYEKRARPSELSVMLDRPKGSLTTIIKSLVENKIIRKLKDPADERSYFLELTDAAYEFLAYKKKIDADKLEQMFSGMPVKDEVKICEGIDILVRFLYANME